MENEQIQVLKEQNRILRKINSALRKTVQLTKAYNDALFLELCDPTEESLTFGNDSTGKEILNRESEIQTQ